MWAFRAGRYFSFVDIYIILFFQFSDDIIASLGRTELVITDHYAVINAESVECTYIYFISVGYYIIINLF